MSNMIENLANYRRIHGNDNIQFECETNSAMCLICPYAEVNNRKIRSIRNESL
ncbi:MAG: hypothetical protein MJ252_10150 [archaeon]|nr:hypothetical protein [archaeon]